MTTKTSARAWAPASFYNDAVAAADVSVAGDTGRARLMLRGATRPGGPGGLNGYLGGAWHRLAARHDGDTVTLTLAGRQVLTWTDPEPFEGGHVGLYADEQAEFDDLTVTP